MTPLGHLFAGRVTFCAFEEPNYTRVEVQVLMRSADPLIEMGLRLGGHRAEDQFWLATLENLARHLGIIGMASYNKICLDKKIQWHEVRNLRHNVLFGSTLYAFSAPLRWLGSADSGQKK